MPQRNIGNHSLSPETESEVQILVDRLASLSGRVMGVQDWRSLFSACRRLLPRGEGLALKPCRMDLHQYSLTSKAQVLSATLAAFASCRTYSNNRRYYQWQWLELIE